ncbi:MAG TPA: hypothetical protein VGM92_00795, partial [Candidatus Kapabacteria bacterium]
MRVLYRSLALILIATFLALPAKAQWALIASFPGGTNVSAVYFIPTAPSIGFACVGNTVYRTANSGGSWQAVLTGNLGWGATSFVFTSSGTGWMSVGSGTANDPGLYGTVDGGSTWRPLNIKGYASHVYYNASNGLLFLGLRSASANGTSLVSSNGGASWTPIVSQFDENGFTFVSGQVGILTAHTVPFYRTTNGGSTWYNLGYTLHSWSAAAEPGTNTIVAAEDQTSGIYESIDAGVTWSYSTSIGSGLTGCVETGPCNIYVQANDGIYNSGDLVHWVPLHGPGNTYDTRFYVGPNAIYAGDDLGNVWELEQHGGGWPTVVMNPQKLNVVAAAGCPVKPVTVTFTNVCCLPITISQAVIADSAEWNFSSNQTIPVQLAPNDSITFTITVRGDSSGTFHDALDLHILTSAGSTDTLLPISLEAGAIIPPTLTAPSITLKDRCTSLDTTFSIENNHCDTVEITRLTLLDSTLFTMPQFALPISLASDSTIAIPLFARPKRIGNFLDTIAIALSYHGATLDTTLVVKGSVKLGAILSTLSTTKLLFDTLSACSQAADTVYVRNSSCDSIQISQISTGGTVFSIPSSLQGEWVQPEDSLSIPIGFAGLPGSYTDELDLFIKNGGSFGLPLSTSLMGTVVKDIPALSFPSQLEIDSVSPCSLFDTTIEFTARTNCDSIVIATLSFSGNGSASIQTVPALPYAIHSGDTLRCTVRYQPNGSSNLIGTITAQGPSLDTALGLRLSFRSDTEPLQLKVTKNNFLARPCQIDSAILTISNPACVATALDSLTIEPTASGFTTNPFALPIIVPADSSLDLILYFTGDEAPSPSNVTLHTRDGLGHAQSLPISGTIIPPDTAHLGLALQQGSTLTPIAGGTVTPLLYFADSVSATSELQTMRCTLNYNGNFFGYRSVSGLSGWSIQETDNNGVMELLCTRATSKNVSPMEPIATVNLEAYVTDSASTSLALSQVTFTPNDPSYESCTLASAIATTPLTIQLTPLCGDSIIMQTLREEPILFSLHVQPIENALLVSFLSTEGGPITLSMSDLLGRVRSRQTYESSIGTNVLSIPT